MSADPRERPRPRRRVIREWWLLSVSLAATALVLGVGPRESVVGQLARIDTLLFDAINRLAPRPAPENIAVIEIDEDSIARIGRWPWGRGVHAALIERLSAAGARAIGFDVLFSEDDVADAALGRAIARAPPTVLPVASTPGPSGTVWPMYPVDRVGRDVSGLGHAHFRIDDDGAVRGLYLEEAGLPAFSLAVLEAAGLSDRLPAPAREALKRASTQRRNQSLAEGRWPTDDYMLLPASNPPLIRDSYARVLLGDIVDGRYRDRIVLIGATATGLGDVYTQHAISGEPVQPGVYLHAAAIGTLLQHRLIERAGTSVQIPFAVAIVFASMLLLYRSAPRTGLLVVAPMLLGTVGISALGLKLFGIWIAPAGTLVAVALAYPLWSWRRLEAAVSGLIEQARALRDEPNLLPPAPEGVRSLEPVARELQAFDGAAERIRTLRRLLFTVIDRLPNPAIVATADGRVLLSNRVARTVFERIPIERQSIEPWLRGEFGDCPALRQLPTAGHDAIHGLEVEDRRGHSWLVDIERAQEKSLPLIWMLQFTDITPIRKAQRAREEMLRFLSHDMRSPAVSVLSMVDSAQSRGEGTPLLAAIESQTRTTLELAEGFVQWARAENKVFDPQPIDLLAIASEAVDALWELAKKRHSTIRLHAGTLEDAPMRGDAQLIRRALSNLLENAIKYGPEHGLVDLSLGRRGRYWLVTVADSGPGLGIADPASLFEPYVRGKQGETRSSGGGLGLALVRVVAERHGGRAFARDCAPSGAEFHLEFPAAI